VEMEVETVAEMEVETAVEMEVVSPPSLSMLPRLQRLTAQRQSVSPIVATALPAVYLVSSFTLPILPS